jgi:acyl dehydratase
MAAGTPTTFTAGDMFSKVLVEDLKRTQIVQYAGASGDFNALHTDESGAGTAGPGGPGQSLADARPAVGTAVGDDHY